MTREQAIDWCKAQLGKALDYDGQYSAQCVDFFNFYYRQLTGRNPYSDGFGVPGAKDLWNVRVGDFEYIANDPNDVNQLPSPGDIIIYSGNMPGTGGYGHVAIVGESKNVYYEQNYGGMFVKRNTRQFNGHEIGWLSFKGFNQGGDMAINPDFIRNMFRWVGGREASDQDIATHMTGTPQSLLDGFIRHDDLEVKRLRNALAGTRQQLVDVQTALANEQAKPPKEVVKEVEKIVEKIVEVEKPVIQPFTDKDGVNWLTSLLRRIFK